MTGNQEIFLIILRKLHKDKGYYREVLIQILQEKSFSRQEIENGLNYLRKIGMITCYGFHTAYSVHLNIKLIFEKNPQIEFSKLLEMWNDPEIICKLWEIKENEH